MAAGESPVLKGQPGVTRAALFACCPRCGARTLWGGPATFTSSCSACGQDFAAHEPKGRSLFLVVLPVTALLVLAAVRLDDLLRSPLWLQAAVWTALVPAVMIGALRFAKAAVLISALRKKDDE
ncbi:DUF983 domain-containing protein [Novosphingobium sp. KCTC 2891]|uniref:DUF983 domain-containing protein n=1 Tax=Novosphingobium sp. KCTC 2891 TaxID=2989730 RepID=UPI002223A6C6|nr:DUF983 domain-containing protein [Novosphingobium sp. KCTC 2891]MCW1382573.1 DUF983 domain-containing protein [Novosphingobium sp. KCTC 2891]